MTTAKGREQPCGHVEPWQGHLASTLPHAFNADVARPRLLFLVSPTCAICVAGALAVAHTVLALPRAAAFRLYILWLPVLEADTLRAVEQVCARLPADDRVGHFWDPDLQLSRAYHGVLQLGDRPRRHRVAWDLFLLYDVGRLWQDTPPMPDFWMHQLWLDEVPTLDATVLRHALEQRMPAGTDSEGAVHQRLSS